MKLRNKTTGWITEKIRIDSDEGEGIIIEGVCYDKISDIYHEWEDYEEPKEYWMIDCDGEIEAGEYKGTSFDKDCKVIGNYFATKEEAEQTVEKLKAWKRLKDNGFKFRGIKENWVGRGESPLNYMRTDRTIHFNKQEDNDWLDENWNDLLLLFGDEE